MAKLRQKRDLNQAADRFYEYLMERKGEVLRYITVALVTGIIEFLMNRFLPLSGYGILLPFLVRFFATFYLLKYWAYGEIGSGPFYTGRQLMIGFMLITVTTWALNLLTVWLAGVTGNPTLINYVLRAVREIAYFVFFQFIKSLC